MLTISQHSWPGSPSLVTGRFVLRPAAPSHHASLSDICKTQASPPAPHCSNNTTLHPKDLFSKCCIFWLKTNLIDSSIQEWACEPQQTAKAGTGRNLFITGEDFHLLQNMDAAYVKQSSFDKLTAGWFSREETAYWARMISPRVSSTSSMRLHQHVWIPTVQNVAPLVNFKLTSLTLTQINTKPAQLISELRIK